jgi:hypothetical protein
MKSLPDLFDGSEQKRLLAAFNAKIMKNYGAEKLGVDIYKIIQGYFSSILRESLS